MDITSLEQLEGLESLKKILSEFNLSGLKGNSSNHYLVLKKNKSSVDKTIADIIKDPKTWYERKNPNYQPINDINIKVPEFKVIIANMIKNLLLVLRDNDIPLKNNITKKNISRLNNYHPLLGIYSKKNNTKNINTNRNIISNFKLNNNKKKTQKTRIIAEVTTLLNDLNAMVNNGYDYKQFIKCLSDYYFLFSYGYVNPTTINSNKKTRGYIITMTQINNIYKNFNDEIILLFNTPFILLPTNVQIDMKKTLELMKAPLLNFRLLNYITKIHNINLLPINDFMHDILNHANLTHRYSKYKDASKTLQTDFNETSIAIDKLKKLYDYPKLNDDNVDDFKIKYMNCCIIFYLLHEKGILKTKLINLDSIKEKLNEYITTYASLLGNPIGIIRLVTELRGLYDLIKDYIHNVYIEFEVLNKIDIIINDELYEGDLWGRKHYEYTPNIRENIKKIMILFLGYFENFRKLINNIN